MKHDIYGLGVLLLELQKGRYFGDAQDLQQKWVNLDGKRLRDAFVKWTCSADVDQLGQEFVSPIVYCLAGFENLDMGQDAVCHPRVLREFRVNVLDPLEKVGVNG